MRIVSLSGSRMVNIGRQTLEQKSVGVTRDSRGERSMTISSTAVSACGGGLSLHAGLLIKAAADHGSLPPSVPQSWQRR
jgi:hypothetical protein